MRTALANCDKRLREYTDAARRPSFRGFRQNRFSHERSVAKGIARINSGPATPFVAKRSSGVGAGGEQSCVAIAFVPFEAVGALKAIVHGRELSGLGRWPSDQSPVVGERK